MSQKNGITVVDESSDKPIVQSSSYRNPVSKAGDSIKKLGSENWMSAWNIILVAVVFAILIALVHYYTVAALFNTGGLFHGIGWVATGGGLLFFAIVGLMIGSAGAAFGMSWKKNSEAAMWSVAAVLVLGLLTFYMYAAANDERKDQFILWTVVTILGVVGVAGYGFWSMRGLKNYAAANPSQFDKTDVDAIKERYTYSMAMAGVSALSAVAVVVGTVSMYRAIPTV